MVTTTYDVVVLGLGGMGSSAAYHSAGRGLKVLGLEQHGKAHDHGSSHGLSRVIRQCYFEDPSYVPLLRRAYELWERLEKETGRRLLTLCGGLMIGRPESQVVAGSLASARQHQLPHEMLSAREIRQCFPVFHPEAGEVALYEPRAGWVHPEQTVRAHLDRAATMGAELRFQERVLGWTAEATGRGVIVETSTGRYSAKDLVICPGAWAPEVLRELGLPLRVERQILFWFKPVDNAELFDAERMPIYIWQAGDGAQFYGFPAQPGVPGVKVAFFRMEQVGLGQLCSPGTIDRVIHPNEIAAIRGYLRERIPDLNGDYLNARTCMYTTTPDEHFVISTHPRCSQVQIACGFSGHGYKFASVVGEVLADLCEKGATSHPIKLFAPGRFKGR